MPGRPPSILPAPLVIAPRYRSKAKAASATTSLQPAEPKLDAKGKELAERAKRIVPGYQKPPPTSTTKMYNASNPYRGEKPDSSGLYPLQHCREDLSLLPASNARSHVHGCYLSHQKELYLAAFGDIWTDLACPFRGCGRVFDDPKELARDVHRHAGQRCYVESEDGHICGYQFEDGIDALPTTRSFMVCCR